MQTRTKRYAALTLACLLGLVDTGAKAAPDFGPSPVIKISESDSAQARRVTMGIGKSLVVDLPRDAKEVFVANPAVANAIVRSTRKAFIIGVAGGQTSIFFLDAEGRQIAAIEMDVTRDLQPVRSALKHTLPNARINIDSINNSVVLTGQVANAQEAQQAVEIAGHLAGGADNVVNSLTIRGRDQVMLKVTVAEVQRSVIKQLGIDLSNQWQIGSKLIALGNNAALSGLAGPVLSTPGTSGAFSADRPSFNATGTLRALERNSVLRTIAEPTLTAVSGESASFLAGGEVPLVTGYSCPSGSTSNCTAQVTYKKFGVSLNFTPIVLTEGRISLRVATEISEISADNTATVSTGSGATAGSVSIPGFKTRSTETTVEMPSGSALALAGLIQEQTKQAVNGSPYLQNVPVLGSLFRSRDFQRAETELVILVTPYIARPTSPNELALPDDGFANPSDPSSIFMGRMNRIYGVSGGSETKSGYHGRFGFITD
jgi:pilus assembly protein CpaC